MAKTMMLVLALAAMALAVAAQDPPLCVLEGWKIDPGVYEVANLGGPSFGTFFNTYDHKEFFWVHHNLTIDMYDILDEDRLPASRSTPHTRARPHGSCVVSCEAGALIPVVNLG